MKEICNNCCGCKACENICPVSAISMKEDLNKMGFKYPVIDKSKCINCGQCIKVCPMNSEKSDNKILLKTGAISKDNGIRKQSSSGGIFTILTEDILDKNGIVYGAFLDGTNLYHKKAVNKEERDSFRGSKYIQSDMKNVYKDIGKELNAGKLIYFSGTPCQVVALKNYLKESQINDKNLTTQDFICHGVGSNKFFEQYIYKKEKKYNSIVNKISFRAKKYPYYIQDMKIEFKNGKTYHSLATKYDEFYYFYLRNLISRDSCYNCKFANENHASDITLADCWGDIPKEYNDGLGSSIICANTEKGKEVINANLDYINSFKCENLSYYLNKKVERPDKTNKISQMLAEENYDEIINKYFKKTIKDKIVIILLIIVEKLHLTKYLRKIIKSPR